MIEKRHRKIILVLLLIIFFLILIFIANYFFKDKKIIDEKYCEIDSDCVPAGCCHPDSCISKEKKPNCDNIFCTAVCLGPLDCGAGYCSCLNNKCVVLKNE